jgi:hypothetical protein
MVVTTRAANYTSQRHRFVRMTILLCVAVLLSSKGLHGWEGDLHYLLTFWLADHAGFSRAAANRIAEGARLYDESTYFSAIGSVLWAVLTNDNGAAQSVRDRHFASDGPLPSPPQRRAVRPNSASARRAVETVLAQPDDMLLELGEVLHPLQDSWSHQGVPDAPLGFNEEFAFGHPKTRGGWSEHRADKTDLYPDDALETARVTYEVLLRYLETRPSDRKHAADS